jgi:hypothetical protein
MKTDPYRVIQKEWSQKTDSKGSPYMWHIDMGLAYLISQGASDAVKVAWCIHPLVQDNKDLKRNYKKMLGCLTNEAVMLVIEYRHQANWFSTHSTLNKAPKKNLLSEIILMLKADKLQNAWNLHTYRKDHKNYKELTAYFNIWFSALNINPVDILKANSIFEQQEGR